MSFSKELKLSEFQVLIFIILPLENQVGRSAGYLVERLPTDRTGGIHTEIRGDTGLQILGGELYYEGRDQIGI